MSEPGPVQLPAFGAEEEMARAAELTAVLFVAGDAVELSDLARVLNCAPTQVERAAARLAAQPPPGLALEHHGHALRLTTAAAQTGVVERFLGAPPAVRLSRAALEALAVIVYRQPATRGDVDAVRGVNSDSAIATLLARGLIAELGRRETIGRPMLLGTTAELLEYLGISSLRELPALTQTSPRESFIEAEKGASPRPFAPPTGAS